MYRPRAAGLLVAFTSIVLAAFTLVSPPGRLVNFCHVEQFGNVVEPGVRETWRLNADCEPELIERVELR
jgi:hypothetical protein